MSSFDFVPPPRPVYATPVAPLPPPPQIPVAAAETPDYSGNPNYDPAYVLRYRELRDKKDEIKKRHVEELRPYNDAMEAIEALLLDHLNRTGAESSRTKDGTFFKVKRVTYKVDDGAALREWLEAHQQMEMLENRVSKTVLEAWLDAGNPLPPGISVNTEVEVQVRKATAK
jgi:hypothetical protein